MDDATLTLWDVSEKKPIVKIRNCCGGMEAPVWLSNGGEFLVNLYLDNPIDNVWQDELYNVAIDGKITKLTDFSGNGL